MTIAEITTFSIKWEIKLVEADNLMVYDKFTRSLPAVTWLLSFP